MTTMTDRLLPLFLLLFCFFSCENTNSRTSSVQSATEAIPQKEEITSPKKSKKTILFFGDSLTAGYGLDEEYSFPSLLQNRIDSLGLAYEVINAGLSGETSAGGKGRIDWVLNQHIDIFVLELGANDVLRGMDLEETNKNLRAILDVVKSKSETTQLVIAGMEAPPNMGSDYTSQFRTIFKTIAEDYQATLIPFLLEGVAGDTKLILNDGKHPNIEGQKIVANTVWSYIKDQVYAEI